MERLVNGVVLRPLARFLAARCSIHQFREGLVAKFFGLISVHAGECGIYLENRLPVVDQNGDSESGLLEDAVPLVDLDLLRARFADIAKHKNDAKHLVPRVTNRRDAIVNGEFLPLLADQDGMIPEVGDASRSEEHTSELQSRQYLV